MKISFAVIVKDEADKLDNLLTSVKDTFDEICVTMTKDDNAVEKVCKKHDTKVSHFKWVNDFSKARNFNFAQCTGDWIMWADADDVIRGAENIRDAITVADANGITGLNTLYHYAHDKNGNVTDSHWKLQLVKNGYYEWRGVIHEDLLPIKDGKDSRTKDILRVHTADEADSETSLIRNKKILENILKDEPEEPRHYFYLARCYLGIEEWDKVIDVINTYLTLSDWPEERYDALNMMGEAYLRLEKYNSAIESHQRAISEVEDAPDAYIYKARNYLKLERWDDALTCLEIAEGRDKERVILKKAALYDHDLYVMSAICFMQIGEFAKAVQTANRAYQNRKSEHAKEILELAQEMHRDEQLTKHYLAILKPIADQPEKVYKVLDTVPESISDDPRLLTYRRTQPPKQWSDNSIVWFCGGSTDSWDGDTLSQGIGGSETAVIKLSEEWVKQGKEVVVYNQCDAPPGGKIINGVIYRNYWEFNHRDYFNTVILWRWPQYVDLIEHAKDIRLDMHDVSNPMFFTPERIEKVDKIMVKSHYHRTLYPEVPDDKFEMVGNGIDLTRFTKKEKKQPHRFIYTSCASRGLENVLEMWPEIRKKYPDAELHVFYGWRNYEEGHKNNPAKLNWMYQMKEMMKQDGVINHGRVGQAELAQEMLKSSVWLYPTEFPEIHCITALEMQAADVFPITTGFAALAETQQSGIKIDGDPKTSEWRERCLNEIDFALENPDMLNKQKGHDYVNGCTWEKVARAWYN